MVAIESIFVSSPVEAKINSLHGVTLNDVEDACERQLKTTWIEDEDRGKRLMVRGLTVSNRVLWVVLYQRDTPPDSWNLATAFY